MRMPGRVRVKAYQDHLSVRVDALGTLLGLAASFTVPYSTIRDMRATMPEVPGLIENWLTGFHIPHVVARGRFHSWDGKRSFLWLDVKSRAVLVLELQDHPDYDRVILDVPDPEGLMETIAAHQKA